MRVLLVGASGTIGAEIRKALSSKHEVLTAGRKSGDYRVDILVPDSVRKLYEQVGLVDAVVSAAGSGKWAPLNQLSDADFAFSLSYKLMGQVNLIRYGLDHVNDNGSLTVTSGVLSEKPMVGSSAISMVNAGLEGFVRAAAIEAPRGIRVNVVSPEWVAETLSGMGQDPANGVPAEVVARAYVHSVEGKETGAVIEAYTR